MSCIIRLHEGLFGMSKKETNDEFVPFQKIEKC